MIYTYTRLTRFPVTQNSSKACYAKFHYNGIPQNRIMRNPNEIPLQSHYLGWKIKKWKNEQPQTGIEPGTFQSTGHRLIRYAMGQMINFF